MRGVMTAHHLEGVQTDTHGFAPSACPSYMGFSIRRKKHILPAHRKFFLYFRLSGIYVILIWAILSNLERKSIHVFQPDEKYQSAAQKAQCH